MKSILFLASLLFANSAFAIDPVSNFFDDNIDNGQVFERDGTKLNLDQSGDVTNLKGQWYYKNGASVNADSWMTNYNLSKNKSGKLEAVTAIYDYSGTDNEGHYHSNTSARRVEIDTTTSKIKNAVFCSDGACNTVFKELCDSVAKYENNIRACIDVNIPQALIDQQNKENAQVVKFMNSVINTKVKNMTGTNTAAPIPNFKSMSDISKNSWSQTLENCHEFQASNKNYASAQYIGKLPKLIPSNSDKAKASK